MPPDAAVAEDAEGGADLVADVAKGRVVGFPRVRALLGEEVLVFPRLDQAGEDGPFGYGGAVDARGGGDCDVCRGVDGVGLDVVAAGGEEVEPG